MLGLLVATLSPYTLRDAQENLGLRPESRNLSIFPRTSLGLNGNARLLFEFRDYEFLKPWSLTVVARAKKHPEFCQGAQVFLGFDGFSIQKPQDNEF